MRYAVTLLLTMSALHWGAGLSAQGLNDAIALQFSHPDSAIAIAADIAATSDDIGLRSNALEVVGIAQTVKGEQRESYQAHSEALALREELGWQKGIGHSLNNMGLASTRMGDLAGAMELFLRGLSIAEQLADSSLMTRILGNIGTLYEEQKELDRALEYYERSLSILEHQNDSRILGNTLHNIALVYSEQGETEKAVNFWKRTLAIRQQMGDERGLAHALNNLGFLVHARQGAYGKADSLYHIALEIYERLEDTHGQAMVLGSMGGSATAQGHAQEAVGLCQRSYDLAKEGGFGEYQRTACTCLADAHEMLGNYREANRFLREHHLLTTEANLTESGRKAALLDQRYAHEKEQLRERTIAEEEIKRQHLLRNMSVALGMMGIVLFFIQFNSYRKKQQANELLEEKNAEIEARKEQLAHKNREITDSIQYAKRLQDARLPRLDVFSHHFADWHVLYRPKDIVSGDFYWLEEVDGRIFIAVADCTGHGVPGAMVSMVGIQGLNRAVLEKRLTSPAEILQHLSDHVEEAFNKSGTEVRDGMDIALCVIEHDRRSLTFAGANNPLWQISTATEIAGSLMRDSDNGLHLHEWKAARRSIGGYFGVGGFTEHTVPIGPGDSFIMFSDGYADQFGGEKGRKFGSPRLRKLALTATGDLTALDRHLTDWMENEEQVDDVSVVCFRV